MELIQNLCGLDGRELQMAIPEAKLKWVGDLVGKPCGLMANTSVTPQSWG